MPRATRNIVADDILPLSAWAGVRASHRKALSELKRHRRLALGPNATIYFENWDTMWYQVQEMLWIEKGGEEQLPDELRAYNPMIPQGSELSATLMFEIADETKRRRILTQLGGIEETITISFAGYRVAALPEEDLERTTRDGKTSSIHFLHFPFTPEQMDAFRDPANEVMVRVDHPNYGHAAIMNEVTRQALASDF